MIGNMGGYEKAVFLLFTSEPSGAIDDVVMSHVGAGVAGRMPSMTPVTIADSVCLMMVAGGSGMAK